MFCIHPWIPYFALLFRQVLFITEHHVVRRNIILFSILKGWIQFSYTSSHLWTLVYAIDVRRITFDQPFAAPVYHICAWGGAVALCIVGLTLLYLPGYGRYGNAWHKLSKLTLLTWFLHVSAPTLSSCYYRTMYSRISHSFWLVWPVLFYLCRLSVKLKSH